MRYVRIFLLHFQDAFQNRGRSLVWFIVAMLNPLLLILFWQGAIREHGEIYGTWTSSAITSYYLLVAIASTFLMVHIEEEVAYRDIKDGQLAKYLLWPFSYFIIKFATEFPWRIIQGSFALIVFAFFQYVLGMSLKLVHFPLEIFLTIIIVILALLLSFTFKIFLGLSAFWTTDFWGTISLIDFLFAIFGGVVAPLALYPSQIYSIATALPFAYIVYFPVTAIEGLVATSELYRIISVQSIWLLILYVAYRKIWSKGLKKFTAIGQ